MDRSIKDAESRPLALASLYICESLLLELRSRQVVDTMQIQGLLRDASSALAATVGADREDFVAASKLIEVIRERYERAPINGTT